MNFLLQHLPAAREAILRALLRVREAVLDHEEQIERASFAIGLLVLLYAISVVLGKVG